MIWFVCKQCGKPMKQAENAAGSLVFCSCGQANRVPWESTLAPEPESAVDEPPREEPARPRRSRRPEIVPRDPAYCFNHQDIASELTCADCNEHFCSACVVSIQGQTLCGPCKNYRVAKLQRSRSVSGMAIGSLVVAIFGGPFGCCLTAMGMGNDAGLRGLAAVFALASMILPGVAILLGFLALRDMERNPRLGGQALAITGAVAGVVGVVASVMLALVAVSKPLME
jgi:hypothetical protein